MVSPHTAGWLWGWAGWLCVWAGGCGAGWLCVWAGWLCDWAGECGAGWLCVWAGGCGAGLGGVGLGGCGSGLGGVGLGGCASGLGGVGLGGCGSGLGGVGLGGCASGLGGCACVLWGVWGWVAVCVCCGGCGAGWLCVCVVGGVGLVTGTDSGQVWGKVLCVAASVQSTWAGGRWACVIPSPSFLQGVAMRSTRLNSPSPVQNPPMVVINAVNPMNPDWTRPPPTGQWSPGYQQSPPSPAYPQARAALWEVGLPTLRVFIFLPLSHPVADSHGIRGGGVKRASYSEGGEGSL